VTPERWQRITEAFHELSAMDEAGQAARLAELGHDDPSLRDELAGLLDAASAATEDSFLEDAPPMPRDLAGAALAAGDRLGPYQLIAEIGRGGMGTVYRARRADGTFAKEVAIKVVSAGMDRERVVRRFLAERDILARLEHPNIARLLDGGQTADGRPYFVMELVEGLPLDRWVVERRPSLAQRLDVFLALCDAVQRAHRSLVIHRDLKPANVLVGRDGVPRLLDFGIAKLLVPGADVTRDELLATPAYASPEQLRGDAVTTSTDVHGLGLLLFVLLTGRPPFVGDAAALRRALSEEPPPRPSAVATRDRAALAGDLDTIVAMALRKEPDRRYPGAGELAEDVRRHLAGLPVRARGDGLLYRGGRFVRRHWVPLATAAAVLIALGAGLIATRRQADVARRERVRAERHLVQVRELASALVFDVEQAVATLPGATPVRQLVVTRALSYLDTLAAEAGDSAALARELVAGYRKLGDVQGSPGHSNLGDTAGAEASYRKALAIAERWAARHPADTEAAIERAALLDRLAALRWFVEDLDGAVALDEQALAVLAPLPPSAEVDRTRITVWSSLADCRFGQGRRDEALVLQQTALGVARTRATSGEARDVDSLATSLIKIGDLHRFGDALDAAEAAYGEALVLREARLAASPDDAVAGRSVSLALTRLVKVHKGRGQLARAVELQDRVLALDEAAVRADPDDARARRDLAASALESAQLHDALGDQASDPAVRRDHFRVARERFERALGLFTALITDGGAHASDAVLPDGIRQRIEAVDASLAALPP